MGAQQARPPGLPAKPPQDATGARRSLTDAREAPAAVHEQARADEAAAPQLVDILAVQQAGHLRGERGIG